MSPAAEVVKEFGERCVLIVYDVPSRIMCSPPSVLRARGIRINLSCWIVPESRIPSAAMNRWTEQGVSLHMVRFDEAESARIQRLAKDSLVGEVARIEAAMRKAVGEAEDALALLNPYSEAAVMKRQVERNIINRAKKLLRQAEEAAVAFDITADLEDLIRSTALAIAARHELFVSTTVQRGLPLQVAST